jgi:hypothetical protein
MVQPAPASLVLMTVDRISRLYKAALLSMVLLVGGTLAYPDTFVRLGLRIGPFRVSPLGVLFVLAAPAITWFAWTHRSWLKWRLVDLFLLALMLFVLVRGVVAATNGNQAGLVGAYVGYALLLYYGMAVIGQEGVGLRIMFMTLITMSTIAAAYALIEFFLGRNVLFEDIISKELLPFPGKGYHRSSSTIGHPGPLGTFIVQVAPFFLFYFIRARTVARRLAWGAAIVLGALAILVTFSKGVWAAAAFLIVAGMSWLIWQRPSSARSLLLLLLTTILAVGAFVIFNYDTVNAGTFSKARTRESFAPRSYMWSKVPSTFLAHPLVGAGMWQAGTEIFRVNPAPEWGNRPTSIDNLYLTVLVEQGIVGIILAGTALVFMGRQGWQLLKEESGRYAIWGLAPAVSMVLILIKGLTSDSVMIWPNMVVFWLTAGMLRSLVEGIRHRKEIASMVF